MAGRCIYTIVFLAAFILPVGMTHAEKDKDTNIGELFYKNSLFHYYSGDYISALTKTLINDKKSDDLSLNTKNKLLLGGIYLAYGLDYDAKSIFEAMEKNDIDEETRNIIWFYLGRDFYTNFDYANSEVSLEKITNNISEKNQLDKVNILSNVYVYNNNLDKLENVLNKGTYNIDAANYIKFNLGVGYLRNNNIEKGKKYLSEVANIKPATIEQTSIRDKAKLHLANLSFKEKNYSATIKYINEMDANGIFSESAIYLSALSHSINGNSKKAFSLLSALKSRQSKNIYKYYSTLLISRILEQNGNLEEALQVLNKGVSNITDEKNELNKLLEKIRNDFFLSGFSKDESGDIVVTNNEYKSLVSDLVFNREFSGLYNHYIDLLHLQKTIRHWSNQIPEFYIMLKERDSYFRKKKKLVSVSQYYARKKEYLKEYQSLESSVNDIRNNRRVEGLFNEEEAEYADDLDYISKKISRLSKHDDFSDYKEKVRIMKGLNYWNAAEKYHSRLWQAQDNLNESKHELEVLDKRISSLEKSSKSEFNYSKHKNNVDSLYARLHRLDNRLKSTTLNLKEQLVHLAAAELDKRYKDIDSYYRAFRFDVARVSDRIVLNKNQ